MKHAAEWIMSYIWVHEPSVPRSVLNPLEPTHVNVDGTLNILVSARDAKSETRGIRGSSAVYGETPTLPEREKHASSRRFSLWPVELAGEIYGQVFQRCYGLELVRIPDPDAVRIPWDRS